MSTIATIVAAITVGVVELLIYLVATVVSAIATLIVTRAGEASNRRRDRYAQALQTLVAWIEFPYRVRRRTDDNPATLTALANHGHELQERLAYHQVQIATDHPDLARAYSDTRAIIDAAVGPAISDAWRSFPVTRPTDMNLDGWGPGQACRQTVIALQDEIQGRFGFRRFRRFFMRTRTDASPASTSDSLSTPDEKAPMDYETVFDQAVRRRLTYCLFASMVIPVSTIVFLLWKIPQSHDLVIFGRWILTVLSNFILASMALFWWLRRTILSWPGEAKGVVIIIFLLSWVLFFLGFVFHVVFSLTSDSYWAEISVGLCTGLTLSLFGVGIVGVRVLDAYRCNSGPTDADVSHGDPT